MIYDTPCAAMQLFIGTPMRPCVSGCELHSAGPSTALGSSAGVPSRGFATGFQAEYFGLVLLKVSAFRSTLHDAHPRRIWFVG